MSRVIELVNRRPSRGAALGKVMDSRGQLNRIIVVARFREKRVEVFARIGIEMTFEVGRSVDIKFWAARSRADRLNFSGVKTAIVGRRVQCAAAFRSARTGHGYARSVLIDKKYIEINCRGLVVRNLVVRSERMVEWNSSIRMFIRTLQTFSEIKSSRNMVVGLI